MQKKGFKDYKVSNARYDMRKLREKSLIEKIKGKQKSRITKAGIYTLAAALCIWKQEMKPMLAAVCKENINQDCKEIVELEKKMIEARNIIKELSALFGVKFAA